MKIEHLKFMQSIISRMANNSNQIKRLALVVIPILALTARLSDSVGVSSNICTALAACILILLMCWLDASYLRLERAYRKMYEAVVAGENIKLFDLNVGPYLKKVSSAPKIMFSWSVLLFYLGLFAALAVMFCIHQHNVQ